MSRGKRSRNSAVHPIAMPRRRGPASLAAGIVCALLGLFPSGGHATCQIGLGGAIQVGEGQTFDLHLQVLADCDSFNAYATVIRFDPTRLAFIEQPASQQEGPLMTGACGIRFHDFAEADGTITLTHALLCAGTQVSGPGVLYHLRFQALDGPTVTHVLITDFTLAAAGAQLPPPQLTNAVVTIGTLVGIADPVEGGSARLAASPNPFKNSVRLTLVPPGSGPARLEIVAVDGRHVFTVFSGSVSAGLPYVFHWDGRSESGAPVAPGVYFQRLQSGGVVSVRPLVRLN